MKASLGQQAAVSVWLSIWFLIVYNGCNYAASLRSHVGSLYFEWERHYPFVPALIVAYWSMDLFFVAAPFLCKTRFQLTQHLKRITLGIAIAGFFFLTCPLTLAWPRPVVTGPLGKLFTSLEVMNNFYNCLPSLHIVLRVTVWEVVAGVLTGWALRLGYVWFFLITLSTLLCWQHYLVDVLTGQLVGWLCLHLVPPLPPPSLPARVDKAVGRRYLAGCVLLLALTAAGWPTSVGLLWPALSLALVAVAYAGAGAAFFRKIDGRQLPATAWLLAPYRWGAALTALYFNAGQPAWVEIQPGLLMGRRLRPHEAQALPSRAVLDLTVEYDEIPSLLERTYKNVGILDLTAPSLDQLKECVDFLQANPNCFVHCALGLGRTAVVVAAYLMAQGRTRQQALDHLYAVCPRVRLRPCHMEVLEEFATQIQTTPI